MKYRRFIWLLPLPALAYFLWLRPPGSDLHQDRRRVLVVIEDRLASPLDAALAQYREDLQAEGYGVDLSTDVRRDSSPLQIRTTLQKALAAEPGLIGAVLIGNIPALFFNEKKQQGDPYWHDYLSDLYYMDLNGVWEDTDSNGVYDTHRGHSVPEIWVSRLRTDTLSSLGDEVDLLRRYFARNHAYRTGEEDPPPSRALVVSYMFDVLRSHWGSRVGLVTPNIVAHQCQNELAAVLLEELQKAPGYQWAIISAASGPQIHHFHPEGHQLGGRIGRTREGRERVRRYLDETHPGRDVNAHDLRSLGPRALFYHLLGSEAGRHDKQEYLAGHYVFGGKGLLAIAGTQHGGAVGTPHDVFYESVAEGQLIGDAWKEALLWMEQHRGRTYEQMLCDGTSTFWTSNSAPSKAVLIGDGTLRAPAFFLSHKEQVAFWRNGRQASLRNEKKNNDDGTALR
jgi:hypothetical protein